jgi:hypothetical protein
MHCIFERFFIELIALVFIVSLGREMVHQQLRVEY